MPGRRNPLSFSRFAEVVEHARPPPQDVQQGIGKLVADRRLVDLSIQFIGARGIPKLDVIGSCDPYFVANIDEKISFMSTIKWDTLQPVWNEMWRVKNVPSSAELTIEFLDKDEGSPHDDYIGKFRVSVDPGTHEVQIKHPILSSSRGTFWFKITSVPSPPLSLIPGLFHRHVEPYLYLFDGPVRYSCHFSPMIGRLTALNDARLYYTWKIFLRGVPQFFGNNCQPWNTGYKAAQKIFGPGGGATRATIQAGHRLLYAKKARDGMRVIEGAGDVMRMLRGGVEEEYVRAGTSRLSRRVAERGWSLSVSALVDEVTHIGGRGKWPGSDALLTHKKQTSLDSVENVAGNRNGNRKSMVWRDRVKPAVYTYIISAQDDTFRFSETGAAFFVDFASKHAQHSNCATSVRYAGEFHPRPRGGWENFRDTQRDQDVKWELVFDNNSGTYAPTKDLLGRLKKLLEFNFPGLRIVTFDREDEELIRSREACREYGIRWRGMKREGVAN